ncbi:tail fiber-like protein [Synechococcus phage S-CAM3]|uniref:Tail fiber-like protein n=1 Tax=Synechococcus phage S-CAM3 TaxID=1883366 RepID=A0A1D8KKE7_9CAUD|nr:tail fiber protein [Synechococcus phage S-CAM3]AOV58855.1 tail fiber-like protein [Synechococcus phage S-CAM3]AOV59094.1 tail fiber-like protein [Synechococcus phage S-CAM3]
MSSHPTFGYLAGVIPSTIKRNTKLYTAQPSELAEGTIIVTHKNPYPTKIRIMVVDQTDYNPSTGLPVPQVATKSFCYFNIFVGEGQTFETQTMYVSDSQSILVWSDRPDTNFVFQGSVVTLPETGSGLIASKVVDKENRQEILLNNGADDQKTVTIFACNKGADVARIRMGVATAGRPYPYIEGTEYYDFNIKLSPGQTYVRTNVRVGENKDIIVRSDSSDVNWVALGTSNFEATTQVSLALPGNLSIGGTSTFQGESTFSDDITIDSSEVDYNLSVLRGYNVSSDNTWYIDSNNGSVFFGDVNLSGNITSTGGITINDSNGDPVFTVDPVTGDVNVGGALSAGTFNYEISIDGDLDLLNNRVINMAEPQAASDAATRRYVDNYAIIYAVALS